MEQETTKKMETGIEEEAKEQEMGGLREVNKGEKVGGKGEQILSGCFQSAEHLFFIKVFLFRET